MNEPENEKLRLLLRSALPPWGDRDLNEDLWPRMLDRLHRSPLRASWFDFALAGLAAAGFVAFPQVIPWVLFQC